MQSNRLRLIHFVSSYFSVQVTEQKQIFSLFFFASDPCLSLCGSYTKNNLYLYIFRCYNTYVCLILYKVSRYKKIYMGCPFNVPRGTAGTYFSVRKCTSVLFSYMKSKHKACTIFTILVKNNTDILVIKMTISII